MAAEAQAHGQDQPRRRWLRYRVQALLDVTVLRSGIPDTVPGRSVNLGEGGVGAVVAGELLPGETVGVEIWLPPAGEPLRTRAIVRNCDKLRSGMEFLGLSPAQQATIRNWAAETKAEPETGVPPSIAIVGVKSADKEGLDRGIRLPVPMRRQILIFALLAAAILLSIFWWHWNRGWEEVESSLHNNKKSMETPRPQAHVPADVMEKLVTHRVDPDYPAAARPEKLKGVVVLDVVVGQDGSVVDMHVLDGQENLAQAAMAAMRWWRFEPYRVDGRPVVVETTVAMEFKP